MFKGFKNKSVGKIIDSKIQKRSAYSGAIKLKKLAVLIDARKDFDILSVVKLADKLGVRSDQLKIMGLRETSKSGSTESSTGGATYFDEKAIGYAGGFKSNALSNFVEEPFDVLINFYGTDIPNLNLVAASSKAKFKVGFADVDHRINDLVIGTPADNIDLFISELRKYLKILNII
ncbi:DUF6913 domain-containing protein [Aquimarina agarivorans]|uniref:DUF6913 domain-containing protein n=1 Tax=Aquimarina agarivorans TaxID=980584 RepID=UPI000248FD42|nr:hypothetical protein [Aquimarina agarivorans]